MKKYYIMLLVMGLVFTNCKKNDDDVTPDDSTEDPIKEVKSITDYPVQDFMWQAMNAFYFWQADVVDLADTKRDVEADYVEFLSKEDDPAQFFYKICNNHWRIVGDEAAVDRFSFLSEDYRDLVRSFAGVSKSNGVEFGLSLYGENNNSDSDPVFGFVRYIVADSDASGKDIQRGDLFVSVNGTDLNRGNFSELLFGDLDTFTLGFATIANNTITPSGRELSLTKQEGLIENPILMSTVIEQNGAKIGYLMYNSFVANFDEQLNDAFGDLKTAGVSELILDFRYNGGGRVSSAVQIASSVYGTKTDELFLKARYNNKIQSTFDPGDGETNFSSTTIDGSAINELNLSKVYVIATNSTASASELVMNGLAPYVDVVHVGTTTVGKNEFSVTFVDDKENNFFYDQTREGNINPNNEWAIQPLLGRNENADGFLDYTNGLIPDQELREDVANMGTLGDINEPLLSLALNTIAGSSSKIDFTPILPVDLISSSSAFKPMSNMMLMDGLLKPMSDSNKK